MVTLTVWSFSFDGFRLGWLRLSFLVDGIHLEPIEMARLQVPHGGGGGGGGDLTGGDPL